MKYRLRDVVDSLDYDELLKMKKDLDSGGFHIKKFIEDKIIEQQKKHEVYCAVCSSKIDSYSTTNFTLIFGPSDFRKKATFCAIDCLKYFLQSLEQIKKEGSYKVVQKT